MGWGIKVSTNGSCHVTKMAAMSIYGKTFKNLLLWNQKADDLETWYAVLVTQVLPNMLNDDTRLTLTYFTAGQIVSLCCCYFFFFFFFFFLSVWENAKAADFQETIEAFEVNIGVHIVK